MKNLVLICLLLISASLSAQVPLDPKDSEGRPHGVWQKLHDNGKIRYTGRFDHGIPVDTFSYYFRNGQLKTQNIFRGKSGICMSFQYGEKKVLAAQGVYNKRKKDGEWIYYNRAGAIVSRVNYKDGLEDGPSQKYHTNDYLAESVIYLSGKKEGLWEQFYDTGKKMAQGQYVNDQLHGEVTYFYSNGKPRSRGNYVRGLMDGTWYFFTDDLKLDRKEIWKRGRQIDDGKKADKEEAN